MLMKYGLRMELIVDVSNFSPDVRSRTMVAFNILHPYFDYKSLSLKYTT